MIRNIGIWDRALRAVLALVLMRAYRRASDFKSWKSALGGYWLMTASAGYCPLYQLAGVSTRKRKPMWLRAPGIRRLAFWR